MAVFRVEKTKDFTIMSNHHLRNTELSLKAKGLLSLMLSLPEDWDYTTKGLAHICRDGVDSITTALKELERHGYLTRQRLRNENGQLGDMDNDLGGLTNARKIKAMLHEDQRFKHIRVSVNPPRVGKDYNEKLQHIREQIKDRQLQCRQKQAAISI